jgi:hypothetical protein
MMCSEDSAMNTKKWLKKENNLQEKWD